MTDERVLDSDYRRRPSPGQHVWHWQDYPSWSAEVRNLTTDIVDGDVVQEIRSSGYSPDDIHTDDVSWLNEVIEQVHGSTIDSAGVLASRLSERYCALRAAHATRAHTQSFYESGIRLPTPLSVERLIEIFGRVGISAAEVRWALEQSQSEGPDGRVYFEAQEFVLVDTATHYAIYGSEYLHSIASHLESRGRRALRHPAQGRPTVFVCDVPIRMMSEDTICGMAREALTMSCWEILGSEEPVSDFYGFCLREPLPPEYIVGHYFPERLRDYHDGAIFRTFDAEGHET